MTKYVIGIVDPKRGNIYLRTIHKTEAHVTSNREFIRPSATFYTPDKAYQAIEQINELWGNDKWFSTRSSDLYKAEKVILKWHVPCHGIQEDLLIKDIGEF